MRFESFDAALAGIYDWTRLPGYPKQDLPDFVQKRIKWAVGMTDEGLDFFRALTAALGYENGIEQEVVEWLPPTSEFIEWRDEMPSVRQMQIAVELIYGKRQGD